MRRATVLAAPMLLLAAGLVLAPPAEAQAETCQSPQLTIGDVGGAFTPDETRTVTATVANPNSFSATADVAVEAPGGWDGGGSESEVAVPAGGEADVDVTLTAPASDGTGGDLVVEATFTCGSPPLATTSSASTASAQLSYEAPGLPWAWIVAGGVALVAAGGGVAAYQRRPDGLEADCTQPVQEVPPGGRTGFELVVENPRDAPDTAAIDVRDPPPGWRAFATVDEVELGPGEVRNPTLAVVAPEDADAGESARLAVDVTSGRSGESTTVPVRVDVVAPDGRPIEPPDVGEEQHS